MKKINLDVNFSTETMEQVLANMKVFDTQAKKESEDLNEYNVVLTFHMSNIKAKNEDDAFDIARELIEDGDGIEDIESFITLA